MPFPPPEQRQPAQGEQRQCSRLGNLRGREAPAAGVPVIQQLLEVQEVHGLVAVEVALRPANERAGSLPVVQQDLEIEEIKTPDMDAYLVAMNIAGQVERRVSYRRAMKRALQQAIRQGAQGIKVEVAGRLSGAEMARSVSLREGRVPLQTLRADIDFARAEALTTYGRIGVKVWVYKGDVLRQVEEKIETTEGVYVSE